MEHRILTQKEIDELFARYQQQSLEVQPDLLNEKELDTVAEVANICMGTAATSLFKMLGHQVVLSNPKVIVCPQEEIFGSFGAPYMIIQVGFTKGLSGFNVLVITHEDIAVLANLMMGGTGDVKSPIKISEMESSAVTELMNQMIGASATAMAELFDVPIDITPPRTTLVSDLATASRNPLPTDKPVVVVRFETEIGCLIKTTIMQITSVDAAREEAHFLLMKADMIKEEKPKQNKSYQIDDLANLDGAMEVPAEIEFVVGRKKCAFLDIAKLNQGDKFELPLCTGSQVELTVNGHVVARGKLVLENNIASIELTEVVKGKDSF